MSSLGISVKSNLKFTLGVNEVWAAYFLMDFCQLNLSTIFTKRKEFSFPWKSMEADLGAVTAELETDLPSV